MGLIPLSGNNKAVWYEEGIFDPLEKNGSLRKQTNKQVQPGLNKKIKENVEKSLSLFLHP